MSDSVRETIGLVQGQIRDLEQVVAEKKRMVNSLCALVSDPPIYADTEATTVDSSIRSDEFYGQPLAKAARMVLEKRKAANLGAASVAEIFDAMTQGGFDFGRTGDANAKRNLRISLTKNSATFHKLPGGKYGLLSWYPAAKQAKSEARNGNTDDDDEGQEVMKEEFGEEEQATKEAAEKAKQ